MRFATIAFLGALMPAVSAPGILASMMPASPAGAAEFGSREEAVAMVKRVQAKVKKDGLEATYKAVNAGAKEFKDRDLYVFIIDFTGMEFANGGVPAVIGKNVIDLRDQDGKYLVRGLIDLARDRGSGWYDYRWINPVTKTVEEKSSYIERLNHDILIGVGIYKNEQPNVNVVGVISGSPNSDDTYLQMAYDLAEVLNDGENLRVMPIAGIGGPRNIRDVRYVKGIDIGLTQTSILNNFRRSNERMGQTENRLVYIAKLFNEEVHLVARNDITSIEQLKGLKVNLDAKGSGTSYSMRDIFKILEIEVDEVSMSQTEAISKVRSGEIAATALIAGKPVGSMSRLKAAEGLHFVPIPFSQPLIADYLPTALTSDDYPALVPAGQSVETIGVGAVLITYNAPKGSGDRNQRVEKFVEAFFAKIDDFKKPGRHPKWREVNLAATLPDWTRFEPAQNWLDRQRAVSQSEATGVNARTEAPSPIGQAQQAGLYQDFLRWRQQQQETGQRRNP
jgi:TRAP transporter TAXI family solute receptor